MPERRRIAGLKTCATTVPPSASTSCGSPRARRLDACRLSALLLVLRRPRRIAESLTLLSGGELEQPVERTDTAINPRMAIANCRKARQHRRQRERRRLALIQLRP